MIFHQEVKLKILFLQIIGNEDVLLRKMAYMVHCPQADVLPGALAGILTGLQ